MLCATVVSTYSLPIYAKCSCLLAAPSTPYFPTNARVLPAVSRLKNIKIQNAKGKTPLDHPTGIIAVPAVITAIEYFCFLKKPPAPLITAYNRTYKKIDTVEHILRSSERSFDVDTCFSFVLNLFHKGISFSSFQLSSIADIPEIVSKKETVPYR